MAKVVLPLLGVEARGQIGHAMVYMPISHAKDGLNSVRMWTKPSNPQTEGQGDVRLRVKAVGYGMRFIEGGSVVKTQIAEVTPAGKIWNAYFVGEVLGPGFANIDASLTAYVTAANSVGWASVAESLGLVDQDIAYASIDAITAAEVIFCAARAAYRLSLAITPADAQDMTSDDVASFAAAYLSV